LLEIRELHKAFGDRQALRGVSFSLKPAERLAFLGPNGAGKTTLIRCLSGRVQPDQGEISLFGSPLSNDGQRECLGLVPQEIAIYGDLTTRENLVAFGKFHGLRGRRLRRQVDWALQWTGLENRADDFVGGFSGGMKRRVNLACGVLHEPKILLLDEPTVGVDPQSRQRIFAMLSELSAAGTAILLTTHHLDEAQTQSDRIVIVDQGSVVADGTFEQLVAQTVGDSRVVRLRVDQAVQATPKAHIHANVQGDDRVPAQPPIEKRKATLTARIQDVGQDLPALLRSAQDQGYDIHDVEVQTPSLHHVFLHLTGHELRD